MKTFGFVGGDLRNIRLAESLAREKNKIYTYGLDEYIFNKEIEVCSKLEEGIIQSDYIICPIPLLKDENNINIKFSEKEINIIELFAKLRNKKIITGVVNDNIKLLAQKFNIEIYDIMENEYFTILNVIPTVEGAIQVAINKTEITIHESEILILGFGRIGKLLANILSNMGAKITCEARKEEHFAWIKAYGYNCIELQDLTTNLEKVKYDMIFNTIPYMILNKERLLKIDKETLIIDLASKPGGIDFELAKRLNLKVQWALALPGETAPKTAAEYMKQTIYKIIN